MWNKQRSHLLLRVPWTWYPAVSVSVDLAGESEYIGAATKKELTLYFLHRWTFREAVSHFPNFFFSFLLKPRVDGNIVAKRWLELQL